MTAQVVDEPSIGASVPLPNNLDAIPVQPTNRVGVNDMNGPEIEAVLNLLEGNRTSLKLAL